MPYDKNTKTITAPVSIGDVQQALRSGASDVASLCKSSLVNIWSRHKPIAIPNTENGVLCHWIELAADGTVAAKHAAQNTAMSYHSLHQTDDAVQRAYGYGLQPMATDTESQGQGYVAALVNLLNGGQHTLDEISSGWQRVPYASGGSYWYNLADFAGYRHDAHPAYNRYFVGSVDVTTSATSGTTPRAVKMWGMVAPTFAAGARTLTIMARSGAVTTLHDDSMLLEKWHVLNGGTDRGYTNSAWEARGTNSQQVAQGGGTAGVLMADALNVLALVEGAARQKVDGTWVRVLYFLKKNGDNYAAAGWVAAVWSPVHGLSGGALLDNGTGVTEIDWNDDTPFGTSTYQPNAESLGSWALMEGEYLVSETYAPGAAVASGFGIPTFLYPIRIVREVWDSAAVMGKAVQQGGTHWACIDGEDVNLDTTGGLPLYAGVVVHLEEITGSALSELRVVLASDRYGHNLVAEEVVLKKNGAYEGSPNVRTVGSATMREWYVYFQPYGTEAMDDSPNAVTQYMPDGTAPSSGMYVVLLGTSTSGGKGFEARALSAPETAITEPEAPIVYSE